MGDRNRDGQGRFKAENEPRIRSLTVRLSEEDIEWLEWYASDRGCTKSEAVRDALKLLSEIERP